MDEAGMDLISEFKGPFRAVAEHPTAAIGARCPQVTTPA